MAFSTQSAVSDGTLTNLNVSIGYIKQADISVFFNGVPAGSGTWAWVGATPVINFTPAVANGVVVLLRRTTQINQVINRFAAGAAFTNQAMDTDFVQMLYLSQEFTESGSITDMFSDLDFHGFRPTNIGTAINPTDAISLAQYQADASGAFQAKLDAEAAAAAAQTSGSAIALKADLANDTDPTKGSAMVGALAAGTSVRVRTVQGKQRDIISMADTDADFTGAVDSTAALNSRMALLPNGGIVYLGRGTLRYTNITVPAGVTLCGENPYASILTSSSLTTDNITLSDSAGLENLRVTSTAPKTASDSVKMIGNACFVRGCEIQNYLIGVGVRGPGGSAVSVKPQILGTTFSLPSLTIDGAMILGGMYSNLVIHNVLGSGPLVGAQPSAGIRLLNGDTSVISDTNITRHGAALLMDPDTGQNIYATQINNSLFDSAVGHSSGEITPRGGNIYSTKISNTWFGLSDQSGLLITGYGAGVADGIQLNGIEFPANAAHGLQANGSQIKNLGVVGGWSTGNGGNGYYFSGSISGWSLTGGFKSGNVGGRGVNAGYGVRIDAGAADYLVGDGDARGNTSGSILYPVGVGTGHIHDVVGFNPVGYAGIALTASPFTYNSGPVSETVYITGGTVSAIAVGGVTVLQASPATVHLGPNESVVVTYTAAPFMNKFIH